MSTLDEVKQMQQQGVPEDQIVGTLQNKGIPYKDISEALAQSKIKAAVEQIPQEPVPPLNQNLPPLGQQPTYSQTPRASPQPPTPQEIAAPSPSDMVSPQIQEPEKQASPEMMQGMQQSMLQATSEEPQATQEYIPTPQTGYGEGSPLDVYGYDAYEYQGAGISPDTITEISEQIFSEKITEIRKHMDKVMDFKTTIEAKTESMEDRLKRIEKIIDTLQSSILRKVGDYVTNISDIKKELIETQKTFSKLVPEMKKYSSHKTTHKRKTTHKKTTRKKK
jgi:hypothetical protein